MATNIKFEIKVEKDLREQLLKATEEQIALALEACGSEVERNASDYCPVDTGFLRNSITYALGGEKPEKTTYRADKPDKQGKIKEGHYDGTAPKDSEGKRSVIIGSNLPYARKMEFGGSKVKAPNGYLRIAVTRHLDDYKNLIINILKQLDK